MSLIQSTQPVEPFNLGEWRSGCKYLAQGYYAIDVSGADSNPQPCSWLSLQASGRDATHTATAPPSLHCVTSFNHRPIGGRNTSQNSCRDSFLASVQNHGRNSLTWIRVSVRIYFKLQYSLQAEVLEQNDTFGHLKISDQLLVFIENMYVLPFLRYAALENGVTLKLVVGSFKVIEMAPFDRSYTTFYWSAILSIQQQTYVVPFSSYLTLNNRVNKVIQTSTTRKLGITMAVSLTVYEIFSVKEQRDLENWVRGLFKIIENGAERQTPNDRPRTTFYQSAIVLVNIALSCIVFDLLSRSSRQRDCGFTHQSCSSVSSFVRLSVAKMQKCDFSQKLSNLELWCLLTPYRKLCKLNWAFQ